MRWRILARLLWRAAAAAPLALAADLALAIVQGALGGANVAALGVLVDRRTGLALLLWAATLALAGMAGQGRPLLTRRAQQRVRLMLGSDLLQATARLPYQDFHDTRWGMRLERAGGVLQGDRVYDALRTTLNLVSEASRVAALGVVLTRLSPWLALPTAAAIVVQFWADAIEIRVRFHFYKASQARQRFTAYLAGLFEDPAANAALRLYGATRWLGACWRRLRDQLWRGERALARRRLGQDALVRGSTLAAYLAAVVYGVVLAARGHLAGGAGGVVALAAAVRSIQGAAEEISYQVKDAQDHGLHLLDAAAVLERAAGRPSSVDPRMAHDRIVLRDVGYRYPGARRPALAGVSLSLERGRLLALVGENGAGKTTLARVLLGLLEPTAGGVAGDGGDATRVAAVFQDFVRYGLRVRENVGLADADRMEADEALLGALAAAGPAGLAVGKLGLDALLTTEFSGGRDLSGGQWQAVALARGLFRRGDLVVLDEPTAALDPLAERALFERFAQLAQGRFAVIVTHRMAAAALALDIVVLHRGRVVESGSHAELLALGGRYARLWEAQSRWYR